MARIPVPIFIHSGFQSYCMQPRPLIESPAGNWYLFICDGNNFDFHVCKSMDGRITWEGITEIDSGSVQAFDAVIDGSGIIHIAAIENGADDVKYWQLDTSDDSLTGPVTVVDGASVGSAGNQWVSIGLAVGGNIYIAASFGDAAEEFFYRSTDGGSSFGSRASPWEGAVDQIMLFPGNEADNQDIWALFWDFSANEASFKVYDNSGDSWSETALATATEPVITNAYSNLTGVVMPNGHLYAAFWTGTGATHDLTTWDINGAASITQKTDVKTDATAGKCVAMSLIGSDVYAYYVGSDEGGDTGQTAGRVWERHSSDGMSTWSSETEVSYRLQDIRTLCAPPESSEVAVAWYAENEAFIINTSVLSLTNSQDGVWSNVEVDESAGGGAHPGTPFSQGVQVL